MFNDVADDSGRDRGLFNYVALTKYYKLSTGCSTPVSIT